MIGVASTGYTDEHPSYSDTGPQVEIAAPGGESGYPILSTWPSTVACNNTNPLPGYCTAYGTSMAAAVVSGAAALMMSVRPDLNAAEVRQFLPRYGDGRG